MTDLSTTSNSNHGLEEKARNLKMNAFDEAFALELDKEDRLASFRSRFIIPKIKDIPQVDPNLVEDVESDCIYLCGGSMGLKPKDADKCVAQQMTSWGKWGVSNYFNGDPPVIHCDQIGRKITADLLGAQPEEVALMNGLTVNLHVLLTAFYKPTETRHKIMVEYWTFPSDIYVIQSQMQLHGFDPDKSLIVVQPREGEKTLETEDIIECIEKHGSSTAVILFSGVHYYTGQKFDMEVITASGQKQGCIVGFDLAHAIGSVKLEMHKWGVDFACWCSYKYLNSGPGGLAGIFVHEKHNNRQEAKLLGWWGNRVESRFNYDSLAKFDKITGAEGYKLSNTSPVLAALNLCSLKIFEEVGIDALVDKQFLLTSYMELLINHIWPQRARNGNYKENMVEILTPSDPNQRGNQLSLHITEVSAKEVRTEMQKRGAVLDCLNPAVLRFTISPLYNSFYDIYWTVSHLKTAIDIVKSCDALHKFNL